MAITDKITAIANAIREKTGKNEAITMGQMPDEILSIPNLPSNITAVRLSTIRVDSDLSSTSGQNFPLDLDVKPDMIVVWSETNVSEQNSMLFAVWSPDMAYKSEVYQTHCGYHTTSLSTVQYSNVTGCISAGNGSFTLRSCNSSVYWRRGKYRVLAIKFDK